jgi:hypothetical protein
MLHSNQDTMILAIAEAIVQQRDVTWFAKFQTYQVSVTHAGSRMTQDHHEFTGTYPAVKKHARQIWQETGRAVVVSSSGYNWFWIIGGAETDRNHRNADDANV